MPSAINPTERDLESAWFGGVDIGGTKTGVCIGNAHGDTIFEDERPTDAACAPRVWMDRCADRLDRAAAAQNVGLARIGITVPGPFDRIDQRFGAPPNLPEWHGFELGAWARNRCAVSVRCMNDANAAALAEWRWGGHDHAHTLVFLTLSTGFGGGVVIEGRALEGPRGFAGEVGRIKLADDGPEGFGDRGTAEGFLSGQGLGQMAATEALRCARAGEPTAMADAAPLDSRAVCALAARGDPAAGRVVRTAARQLGRVIAILANVLEPDLVVLGTMGAAHRDLFIPPALDEARRHCIAEVFDRLRVVPTTIEKRWQLQSLAPSVADVGGGNRSG